MNTPGNPHFDRIAAAYDPTIPSHVRQHLFRRRARLVQSLLPGGRGRVMDVGCGTGHLVHALRERGIEADGLDNSAGMLDYARKGPGTYYFADITGTDSVVPADHYDVALTIGMFHHLRTRERLAASVAGMRAMLKPGGHVVIIDPNPLNPYWPSLMKRSPADEEPTRLIPLPELLALLGGAGFTVVSRRRAGWVPDFTPPALLPLLEVVERLLEATPLLGALSAFNVVVGKKPA